MPRLVKGGKWVYGWVVVGSGGEVTIPPEAGREFGFRAGGEAIFILGSRRSGGFGISRPGLMAEVSERMLGASPRVLGRGLFTADGCVTIPLEVGVKPGDRLLAVRGSRFGLGFAAHGPIYEEALRHPELACFGKESD